MDIIVDSIIAAFARARRLVTVPITIVTVTAAHMTSRAAVLGGAATVINVGGVRVMVTAWWQFGIWNNEWMKKEVHMILEFWQFCITCQNLLPSGYQWRGYAFYNQSFNGAGVFAGTAFITHLWQTGVTLLTRARSIARSIVGTTGAWGG